MDTSVFVYVVVLIFVGIVCGLIAALLTQETGRTLLSFCLGAAFGPIGIVMALLLPSDTTESKSRQVDDLNALTKNHGKIGLMLSPDDPQTICSVPINSPAFIAGVRSGDRLVMIDGTICNDDYKNTALKLVGPAGSIVKLTVRRRDEVFEALIKRV